MAQNITFIFWPFHDNLWLSTKKTNKQTSKQASKCNDINQKKTTRSTGKLRKLKKNPNVFMELILAKKKHCKH